MGRLVIVYLKDVLSAMNRTELRVLRLKEALAAIASRLLLLFYVYVFVSTLVSSAYYIWVFIFRVVAIQAVLLLAIYVEQYRNYWKREILLEKINREIKESTVKLRNLLMSHE